MKKVKKHLSVISLVMALLILCQSCVVYHKTPVSLNRVAEDRSKSKLVKGGKAVDEYRFITEDNGRYYGVKMERGIELKMPIEDSPDTEVYIQDKKASKNRTILLSLTTIGIASIILLATAPMGPDWSD